MKRKLIFIALAGLVAVMAAACSPAVATTQDSAPPEAQADEEASEDMAGAAIDKTYEQREGVEVIYLAGGCFWGTEQLMQSIPGVVNVTSGYANGTTDDPTYQEVISGETGHRETVRVEYKPDEISLDTILFVYYSVIDPTIENQQGGDRGTQYQTGVYYTDDVSMATVWRITDIVSARYEKFVVEIEPMTRFYDAEEYHQDYLVKNLDGYCHIPDGEMMRASMIVVDAGDYRRPSDQAIKEQLTNEQYRVTQEDGTEPAFANEYWENHERGIYVDVVTGEPLFSSSKKFESGTGWPSFYATIDPNTLVILSDKSLGMERLEVRSRAGNSHLGHLFLGENTAPEGVRFCMNSASLKFVHVDEMEEMGYGYLLEHVE